MMGMQPNPALKTIDSAVLTPLIRLALDRSQAEVIDWKHAELHGGSQNSEIHRFSGNARDRGEVLPWSLILKIIRSPDGQDDPGSLNYWKREALAYQSGLLDKLPGMICAPRCYAVVEKSGLEMWLWTEEIVDEISGNMSLDQYGVVARHAGQFNGAWFDKQSLLSLPWLGKGRLRDWTGNTPPELPPNVLAHPLVMRYLPNDMYQWMQRVWSEHDAWIDRIESQPQTLSHGDIFRRNLFARRDVHGDQQTVLIDWAFLGSAAAGEEMAPLVAGSLNFLDVANAQAAALDQVVFEGYLEGLRDAGWRGDPREVRFTYAASSILKYSVGVYGVAFWVADESQYPLLEQIFGHPVEELVDVWADTTRFLHHLSDEMHSL
jgi:hypothetical protein